MIWKFSHFYCQNQQFLWKFRGDFENFRDKSKKKKQTIRRFHLWVGLLSVSWKFSTNPPPLRNFKKWRKGGGFVVIPPDVQNLTAAHSLYTWLSKWKSKTPKKRLKMACSPWNQFFCSQLLQSNFTADKRHVFYFVEYWKNQTRALKVKKWMGRC